MQYDYFSIIESNHAIEKIVRAPMYSYKGKEYHPPVCDKKISRLHGYFDKCDLNELYEHVENCFGLGDKKETTFVKNFAEANLLINKFFSHLNPITDNIFGHNQVSKKHIYSLFLPVLSLQRLIKDKTDGMIDDCLLNFVAELLNHHQTYEFDVPVEKSNKRPKILFLSSYDDVLHLNPEYGKSFYKEIKNGVQIFELMDDEKKKAYVFAQPWVHNHTYFSRTKNATSFDDEIY